MTPTERAASPAPRYTPDASVVALTPSGATDRDALRSYAETLRRRWRVALGVPLALSIASIGMSMARERPYDAHAAFIASEPSSASSSLGALGNLASQLGIPALSAVAQGSGSLTAQFYGDLLTSSAMLHAIATTTYDATAPGEYGGKPFRGTLVQYLRAQGKTPTDRDIDAMRRVAKRVIAVAVDRPTGVVRISVRTYNRQLSALVARRALELVNEFNLRRRQTQAGAEREFAARRARAALDTLRAAEATLADFRATNIDFSRSPRLEARETELQRRVSLAQQIYTTVAQRAELASIEAVRNTPVVTVLDAPEGLVEARPRYTAAIAMGTFLVALTLTCGTVLGLERRRR